MLRVESYKRGIIFSTFFNILNKGLVFLNGLLVAYFFGVFKSTDLFFYLYNSVLILGAFFTSLNSSVVIPESMKLRSENGDEKSMELLNFFILLYFLLLIAGCGLILIDPVYFFSKISHFDVKDLADNKALIYLSLPLFSMVCIINLMVDILTSYRYFTVPIFVGIINGSLSILFVLLFHRVLNIESVLVGLLLSYVVNLICLVFMMKRFLRWKFTRVIVPKAKRIWKNFLFAQLGNFTSTAVSYMPMYILSGFNTGIITALTFAQQISSLPSTLITYQFSSVAGIKFNELYAQNKLGELNAVFSRTANFLHFIMIPLSFLIFQFSADIVTILIGFTSMKGDAAMYIALFLKYLSLLLPLLVVNTLIARLFMASHKIGQSFWYQIISNVVLIFLLYIGVNRFGIIGYPIAMVVVYTINLVCVYFLEKWYFNFLDYPSVLISFFKLVGINLFVSLLIFYLLSVLRVNNAFLTVAIAATAYLALLYVVSRALNLNQVIFAELNGVIKKVRYPWKQPMKNSQVSLIGTKCSSRQGFQG